MNQLSGILPHDHDCQPYPICSQRCYHRCIYVHQSLRHHADRSKGTGRIGSHFLRHLLAAGKHNITVLTRLDSNSDLPFDVTVVKVDYDSEENLTDALRGQDFLAISLSVFVPPGTHLRIVSAAAKAGVPYVMPNYYGYGLGECSGSMSSDPIIGGLGASIENVRNTAGINFVALSCGFWYEFSLAMSEICYGFDIKNRRVAFYDDGNMHINTTMWEQCGRALAALLQLPLATKDGTPSVQSWKDAGLHVSSFLISQRDMLDSLHRVLGTTDED